MVGTDLRKSQPSCCRICIAHYCDCRISSVDFLEAWRFAAASGYFSPPTDRCFAHREAQNYRIPFLRRQPQHGTPLRANRTPFFVRSCTRICERVQISAQIMSRNTALTKLTVLLPALVLLTVDANLIFGGTETMSDLHRSTPNQDVPTPEQIAQRAYELYQRRGAEHGRDLEDWLTAERELRNRNLTRVQPAPAAEKRPAISGSRRQSRSKSASAASPAFNNSKPFDTHTTT